MSFQVFHTEETFLMVKDPVSKALRHIPTKVTYSFDYETDPVDVAFDTEEQNKEYINRFDRGELLNVLLKVSVTALGEEGMDYLGACHVDAKESQSDMIQCAIEHDMKNQACIELKENILSKYKILVNALEDKK